MKGRDRAIVNQTNTGTDSKATLGKRMAGCGRWAGHLHCLECRGTGGTCEAAARVQSLNQPAVSLELRRRRTTKEEDEQQKKKTKKKKKKKRERERDRETDRQRDRQTETETDIQTE